MDIIIIRGLPGTGKTTLAQKHSEGLYPLISEHFFHSSKTYFSCFDISFQRKVTESLEELSSLSLPEKVIIEGVLWNPTPLLDFLDYFEAAGSVEIIELEKEPFNAAALLKRTSLTITESRLRQLAEDFVKLENESPDSRTRKRSILHRLQHLGRSVLPFSGLGVSERHILREQLVRARINRVS